MINEEAINRASERFGYFPNGFTSYRETLASISIEIGWYTGAVGNGFDERDELQTICHNNLIAYRDEHGSMAMMELAHTWADEFETKWKGHKWGEDEGPEWYDAIDEFFEEKAKTLEP